MEKFEIIIPTIFGLEAFVSREVRALGYETTSVEDGRVTFLGDFKAVCRANLWVRTGERVLIKVAEFEARTFTELFDYTNPAFRKNSCSLASRRVSFIFCTVQYAIR